MRPPLGALMDAPLRTAVAALALASAAITATLGPSAGLMPEVRVFVPFEIAATAGGAALAGGLAIWVRRRRLSIAILIALAAGSSLLKLVAAAFFVALGEPDPWTIRYAALAVWTLGDVPLALSFLPVLSAARRASRGAAAAHAPAWDAPIQAALWTGGWLAMVCCALLPGAIGWVAWVACGIGLLAAAGLVAAALSAEVRLARWLRSVVAGEVPGVWLVTRAAAEAGALPPVYEAEPGDGVLVQADGATAFRAPQGGAPFAAAPLAPPAASAQLGSRIAPLGYALAGLLFAGGLMHVTVGKEAASLAPRPLTWRYHHYRVTPFRGYALEGLSLWRVEQGAGLVVGWDEARGEVVAGEDLFRRLRALPPSVLADRANEMLFHGVCCVVRSAPEGGVRVTADAGAGEDAEEAPVVHAPRVEGDTLVFWRTDSGEANGPRPYRFTSQVTPEMVAP